MKNKTPLLWGLFFLILAGIFLPACSKSSTSSPSQAAAARALYHCAMHPQIVSDKPGNCPICHMALVPIPNSSTVSAGLPGQADIHLEPGMQQQIGVAVSSAAYRTLSVSIRAAARVAYDPPLYSASLEHQEAAAFLRKAREQNSPELLEQAQATVQASELRLRQMGLSDEQIMDIEKPGYNPSGLLLGTENGRTWVYANVYDDQAALIRPGESAELSSPSMPGRTYEGIVRGIDSILNNETRTLRVRLEIRGAGADLRPETYLSATLHASLGRCLAIPESAAIDTGTRQLVYVEKESGHYEPREVRLGRLAEGYYEVLGGLTAGERVVSSANFLIDSESRIQATTQKALGDVHP